MTGRPSHFGNLFYRFCNIEIHNNSGHNRHLNYTLIYTSDIDGFDEDKFVAVIARYFRIADI